MTKWQRTVSGAMAHVWDFDDDLLWPICETVLPEHEYMMDWVDPDIDGVECCERCQALDNPVSYRQHDLDLDYSPCIFTRASLLRDGVEVLAYSVAVGAMT
ncbi:hypothetical protein BN873_310008 [Candidatus Competibacter denitrificans Run_A_D11]|uniref:Uncharacterized protein n=2 Tax=Candidatus Competibacter TaxID=221279 RepID=W6M796_9GAMM|nr:hypothetical protein BN873_310008 [Candidatus Competibacter denitrificans Run_A_D11]HAS86480.1 hypothetical protein [Candidatus Competibacteraceae bacterium]